MNKFNTLVSMVLLMGTSSVSIVCMDIFEASEKGNIERVRELIAAGAKLEAKDQDSKTPLHWAAYKGNQEVVKALVDAGANLEAKNQGGRTPLHVAAYHGHQEIVQVLIAAGANLGVRDQYGRTSLRIANGRGHQTIVDGITGYQRQVPVIAGTLAQSLHRHLGAESPVGLLPQDLIKNISRLSAAALCFEQ